MLKVIVLKKWSFTYWFYKNHNFIKYMEHHKIYKNMVREKYTYNKKNSKDGKILS